MKVYLLDSNFFIQAHHMDYPLGVTHVFWEKIKILAHDGVIISLDKVRVELCNHEQELNTWCQNNLPNFFFKSSTQLIKSYQRIVKWTISQQDNYLPGALIDFLSAREPSAWLMAYSLQNDCTIVTYERNQPTKKNQIKIPEVCEEFGISYLNTAKMFAELGVVL